MANTSRTKPVEPTRPVEPAKPVEQTVPAPEETTGEYVMKWAPTPDKYSVMKRFIVRLVPPKTNAPSWKGYDDASLRAALTDAVEYAKTHTFEEFRDHLVANGTRPECIAEEDYTAIREGRGPDIGMIGGQFGAWNYGMWSDYYYGQSRVEGPKRYSAKQFRAAGLTDLVPAYTEAASQQKYLQKVTPPVEEANRKAAESYAKAMEEYRQASDAYTKAMDTYRQDLADYEKWLRDNGLWVSRGQYEFCEPGSTADALIEPAEPPAKGVARITDPGEDRARPGWGRVGGSNNLDGWRADAQLIVDIAPVPGTTDVTITARVRGVGITRVGRDVWNRTTPYRASGRLTLLARDTNGNFGSVPRATAEDHVHVTGDTGPVIACTLTHTVPRNALVDYAVDWSFRADEQNKPDDSIVMRAGTKGLKVLFVPPSLDGYRPGTVRDPASGDKAGEGTGRATPIQHSVRGHATVTTAPAKDPARTTITAEVYAEVRGMLGLPELASTVELDIVSALMRYDAATDQWKSAASGSTRATKAFGKGSVTSGKISVEVPTGELNLYRYDWRAGDTFQGGSFVEGALFPVYRTGG